MGTEKLENTVVSLEDFIEENINEILEEVGKLGIESERDLISYTKTEF